MNKEDYDNLVNRKIKYLSLDGNNKKINLD